MKNLVSDANPIFRFSVVTICLILSCHDQPVTVQTTLISKKMPDGTKKVLGALINGKKQGLWITYDVSGKISYQETYVDDSLTGEAVYYRDDGETILSTGVLKNGNVNGIWTSYYSKDHIAEQGEYKDGIKIGIWKYFILEGKLNQEIEYSKTGQKLILDNHLLPPTPDQMPAEPVDSNNRAIVIDSVVK